MGLTRVRSRLGSRGHPRLGHGHKEPCAESPPLCGQRSGVSQKVMGSQETMRSPEVKVSGHFLESCVLSSPEHLSDTQIPEAFKEIN